MAEIEVYCKSEGLALLQILLWIGVGAVIYFVWNKRDSEQPSAPQLNLRGSHFLIDKMNV